MTRPAPLGRRRLRDQLGGEVEVEVVQAHPQIVAVTRDGLRVTGNVTKLRGWRETESVRHLGLSYCDQPVTRN